MIPFGWFLVASASNTPPFSIDNRTSIVNWINNLSGAVNDLERKIEKCLTIY